MGGHFEPNIETLQSGYFAEDELPELAVAKNTADQIAICFAARRDPDWTVVFD